MNTMIKESLYYGKILLFGEYGIIQDSMGLSIPYTNTMVNFFWKIMEESKKSNQLLINFYKYLKNLQNKNELPCPLDLIRFKSDLDNGLHFDSSIPQGFGIGSSGAIVAATYDRYCIENKIDANSQISNENILELKNTFSKLESYYHGTSLNRSIDLLFKTACTYKI